MNVLGHTALAAGQTSRRRGRHFPGIAVGACSTLLLVVLGAGAIHAQDSFADLASRAAAASNANDSKTAIPLYRAALSLKPDWRQGLWMAGSLLYESEQYREAAETLRRLVVLTPQAGPGWALLGLCEYETREYPSSLEHIERAVSLGITDQQQMFLVLRFHQAALLTKFGRFDAALDVYNTFVGGQVSDRQVVLGLGLLVLRRALTPPEIADAQIDLYLVAGNAYSAFLANDGKKAREAYEQLLIRYPNDADVRYAYGYFLFGSDADRAIEEWGRALSIDPSHAGAHTLLAWAFSLRGERQKAIDHASAALKKDPNEAVAHIVLGRALVQTGQVDAGLAHLEQAALLQPGNLETHLALATAYSEAGRKLDAQRERQLCLKKQAENTVAQR